VDVFLTTYKAVGGPIEGLTLPLGKRVVSITKVQQATTPTQLLPLGAAVDAFLAWCEAHSSAYAAVVVSRFDLYLKVDMHALLGDASTIDGFRFLWREAGGHWRYHSDRATTNRTFNTDRRDWRRSNLRAPDALLAFPYAYTSCFRSAVRHEFFPLRDEAKPLGFLHNMIPALRRALPAGLGQPERYSYLVPGQFDSNPCRSSCMLNPIYDLLPRMQWITDSSICPRMEDFTYDKASDSLCCPAPNYCCPNSVSHCREPGAIYFDALKSGTSREAISAHWPRHQARPVRWEMGAASSAYVASVFQEELANLTLGARGRNLDQQAKKLTQHILQVEEAGKKIAALG